MSLGRGQMPPHRSGGDPRQVIHRHECKVSVDLAGFIKNFRIVGIEIVQSQSNFNCFGIFLQRGIRQSGGTAKISCGIPAAARHRESAKRNRTGFVATRGDQARSRFEPAATIDAGRLSLPQRDDCHRVSSQPHCVITQFHWAWWREARSLIDVIYLTSICAWE